MKQPWKVFHDEIQIEKQRREFDGLDDVRDLVVDVTTNALVPHLRQEYGWDEDRTLKLMLDFMAVMREYPRDVWVEELERAWMRAR